jgi:uncharacterized protein YdeI (YjbR/CyaY-like superfamily)
MGTQDERVDAYIASSAEFARPILAYLREVVHAACPEVEEDMKWSFPHFMYKGMLCSMASFKAHCAFGFWKGSLVFDAAKPAANEDSAMGQLGRITKLADLPSRRALTRFIRKAVDLNDAGIKAAQRAKPRAVRRATIRVPSDLASAMARNARARAAYEGFTYSHKKEYVQWIAEAKRPQTRSRRVDTAVRQMAEGKPLHWKYQASGR